jgi:hypothetical protein
MHPVIDRVAEGQSLADVPGAGQEALPQNAAWSGQPVSTPAEGGGVELTGPGLPTVTLLSPTPDRLHDLYWVWEKDLEGLRRKARDRAEPSPAATRGEMPNLEALAARVTPTDQAEPNGSSIAMLLEHREAKLLLSADSFPAVLVPALAALSQRLGIAGPAPVDAVKLSPQGGRANVTQDLLRAVDARHFVFSVNNAYYKHPNAEAVARVIVGGKTPTLWFNHDTPSNRRWGAPG